MPTDGTNTLPTGLASLFDRAAEVRFEARSQDAFALVGQLGVAALPIELAGEGSAVASLVSDGENAPQLRLAFDGLDTALRLDATLQGDTEVGIQTVEGLGSLFVGDVAQLGLMAGMAVPGLFDPIAASAVFDVAFDVESETAVLSGLSGTFADVPISGDGRVERGPLGTSVALDLSADDVVLRGVLAGFLGPSAFDQGFSATWPEGPLVFNPVPVDLTLTLATPRLAIWDGLTALDGTMVLVAEEGRLTLDRLQGEVFGGQVDGRLVLRDADRGGIAEGRLALTNLDVARIAWERDGQPVMDGRLSANLSFESAGGSMASLISGRRATGPWRLPKPRLPGLA